MSPKSKVPRSKSRNRSRVERRGSRAIQSAIRNPQSAIGKARYIMIGGFLGAGKTTSVVKLAQHLTGQGLRVGLITNDQGTELVDTALLRSRGFATEEIPGGCFCCRFHSLMEAATRLTAASRPEVFIAEPVGSCTDLVATVSYPLRRIYGKDFSVAPLSVLIDPIRALRIFGLEEGAKFSEKVLYIYRKQLEEAEMIVINKCDLIEPEQSRLLRQSLSRAFPSAEILEVSARQGTGLKGWFAQLLATEPTARPAMEVDYDLYAEGEALLGWLNATVQLSCPESFDANALLGHLSVLILQKLGGQQIEVAHLKMTLSPDSGLGEIAVVNLVRNDLVPELSQSLEEPVQHAELILNLRAEGPPELLRDAVREALEAVPRKFPRLCTNLEHLEHFRPGKPEPTHRFANVV